MKHPNAWEHICKRPKSTKKVVISKQLHILHKIVTYINNNKLCSETNNNGNFDLHKAKLMKSNTNLIIGTTNLKQPPFNVPH